MSELNCTLDTRQDAIYNLDVNRNRTLNQVFETFFTSGATEYPFDFTPYTGATLQVRKQFGSSFVPLTFSTDDGSIVLGADGKFSLIKSAEDLQKIRAGQYLYDMYLTNVSTPKRAFLSGNFNLINYITD